MGHNLCTPRDGRFSRRGLSFVEFVGCIVALSSGLVIGSIYLGVDVKTLFVGVLEQADIVEPGYFSGQPTSDRSVAAQTQDTATLKAGTISESEGPIAAAADSEPADLSESRAEPAAESKLENVISNLVAKNADNDEPPPTEVEVSEATQEYWEGLVDTIKEEVRQRTALPESQSNWQLFDYLSHRAKGHEQAVEAIEALPVSAVDKQLLGHGEQVRDWHQSGAKLYRYAVALLTSSPQKQFSGPSAQSWQSSSTQHRMEETLVREKHFSISNYLNHTYGALGAFHPAY